MRPIEQYREAERLLESAATPTLVSLPDHTSQDQAEMVETALTARGLTNLVVTPESMRVDVTSVLLAAQVHATLAVAGSQLRSLGEDSEPDPT